MSDESPTPYRPRCMFLSCKSMLVFGEDFEQDPDYQSGSAFFWCNRTATERGPDDNQVSLELCSAPERSCYREY
jgi:hypothetical protein